ncbi:glycoside hydrolase family 18 protein [Bradyrhizobium sp. ISRA443]|uniref:glycoside hydrolase family 18 protein n=1 Tax=unclassified Bradyrhizobium TaxID=2631580 RepID=UPI00247AE5C8|nr:MULTISPECIES: glycoside hydrolase family 18 protein [unclassified Bradyrhizobium]WGR93342.1 glycoside hydrolase family 18 protein [Bradyrhizobium sp. ISRA435]WGR97875.1 glycoside hydrolase family 18 protein [Bradyrhizobium sp. ISRA436]WGS04765.1 glycoside hydrolase family 18 protein [Bradyrhizobium sp. ISRA437]WGS11646.1 glycoside hydrolase family 18 protein [Bradyrhizobium sp. ISRA443]
MVAGYVAPWKVRTGGPDIGMIPARELTHLMYAFGMVSADGLAELSDRCLDAGVCDGMVPSGPFGGNFAQLAELKRINPQLRILISLGGWSGSKYFSAAAATALSRTRFAQSVIEVFFRPYPGLFDGVDVDWEFPVSGGAPGNLARPEDRTNFTLLIAELRRKLAERSASERKELELTIAVSAAPDKIVHLEAAAVARLVDRINLMAYDYHAGSGLAAFNAPLFASARDPNPDLNVDSSVTALIRAGVLPAKVTLGVAFYGRAVAGVPPENGGLFQKGATASREWGGGDGIDYRDLVARRPQQHGFRRYWSDEGQVPWLYNAEQRIWISYDDPFSIARKASYARSRALAGIMIWDLFADDGSLLAALRTGTLPSRRFE